MVKLNYSNSLIELGKRFNFEKDEKTKFPLFKLDRTKKLMNLLGNPQNDNSFTIHIAGTNGKGTVSSIIDSIISKDYKTLAKQVEFLLNSDFDRDSIGLRGSKRMGSEGGSQSLAVLISTKLSRSL